MNEQKIKFAVINENRNNIGGCFIPIEYNRSVYNATKYFIENGYKEITYVVNTYLMNESMQQRYNAYIDVMQEHNLKPIFCTVNEIEEKIHTFRAVITDKSNTAYRVLTVAARLGIKVPDAFEIIAGNTEFYSKYLYPPLTTVRVPTKAIGAFAAKSVLRQINGQRPLDYASQNFEYSIEFRESTKQKG